MSAAPASCPISAGRQGPGHGGAEDGAPERISTVIVSAQHEDALDIDTLRDEIMENVIRPALPASMLDRGHAVLH
jgi:S-adenosylmethionine synthetase